MAQSTIDTSIDNGVLTIKVAGHAPITIIPQDFAGAIRDAATLHGFKQKIVDAAALSRNPDTGASATASDKYHAMLEVVGQLAGGDWNRRATGDGTASTGLLVAALIRVTGNDRDAVEATVGTWTPAQQAAMRADPAVAPVIAAIKAERAAKSPAAAKVDTTSLLAGLLNPGTAGHAAAEAIAGNPEPAKAFIAGKKGGKKA